VVVSVEVADVVEAVDCVTGVLTSVVSVVVVE
jgi:hypothetical protein